MPTARIVIDHTWSGVSGSPGVNVFHARADSVDQFNADFDALGVILETFFTDISGLFCSDHTIRWTGDAMGVGDDEGNLYSGNAWTVTGTNGVDHLAPSLQMLVSWRCATGGASGRGRTFLGPLATGVHESNGTPDESERTTLQTAIDDLITSNSAFGNGALGVYSRLESTFRDFVSGETPNYFASLRSRRD